MRGVIRRMAQVLLVLGLVWGGVIAYWRITGVAPGSVEIVLLLAVLPLVVLVLMWLVRAMLRRRRQRASSSTPAVASPLLDADTTSAEAVALQRPLRLLGGAVRLPLGLEPAGLLGDPLGNNGRLRPHPRHLDRHGMPVYLAMADDIEGFPLLAQEFESEKAEHVRRALALLEPVAEDVLMQAAQALPPLEAVEGHVIAGWRRQIDQVIQRQLSIDLLVPSDWAAPTREACQGWLERSAQQFGIDARRFAVQVIPADTSEAVWSRLREGLDGSAQATAGWRVLLACQSVIAPSSLARWEAAGWLRTQHNPNGRVPGEAAAGVLLGWPAATGPKAVLRSIECAELPERATAAAHARATGKLAIDMLATAAIDAADIDLVLSDADLCTASTVEASSAASQACDELDLSQHYLALSSSIGQIGAVLPLVQLALAQHHLDAGGVAALILSVTPAQTRWAAVVESDFSEQTDAGDTSPAEAAQPETA